MQHLANTVAIIRHFAGVGKIGKAEKQSCTEIDFLLTYVILPFFHVLKVKGFP